MFCQQGHFCGHVLGILTPLVDFLRYLMLLTWLVTILTTQHIHIFLKLNLFKFALCT